MLEQRRGGRKGWGVSLPDSRNHLAQRWTPALIMRCYLVPAVLPVAASHLGLSNQTEKAQCEHFCHCFDFFRETLLPTLEGLKVSIFLLYFVLSLVTASF